MARLVLPISLQTPLITVMFPPILIFPRSFPSFLLLFITLSSALFFYLPDIVIVSSLKFWSAEIVLPIGPNSILLFLLMHPTYYSLYLVI